MDEYTILKKKRKKNGFASTALLISIAIALIAMVGAVLVLNKVNEPNLIATDENSTVEEVTSNKDETCEGLVKEIVFNDNLKTIKEAAISYFTNERLPQEVGDTVKITLKEMKDKKLVLNVRDASGKTCSGEDSYVEVTKEEDEYIMKIFLSCSNMEDYILVHLGCYDYCDTDACEKKDTPVEKEYEYEYKKITGCTMSGWSAWGDWKTKREKTSNLKKEDSKVETSTKEVIKKIDATKSGDSYNCNNYPGYTLVGDKCIKETTTRDVKDATPSDYSYTCSSYPGYSLVGDKCIKEEKKKEVIDATKNPVTYSCPSGYTLNGTKCTKKESKEDIKNGSYTCPSGYTLSGTKCSRTTKSTSTVNATAVYDTRSVKEFFTCYQNICTTKTVFSCTNGACGNYPQTSCEKVKNDSCYRFVDERYISGYTCPSGYTKNGTVCTKETSTTDTKNATFVCPSGYNVTSGKCVKKYEETKTIDATKNPVTYSCPKGYSLNGNKCERTVTVKDTKDASRVPGGYVCPTGYTKDGMKCYKDIKNTSTKDASYKPGTYSCPEGYTLNDKVCTKKVTETIKTTYYRYATRSCNGGSTSIKWSTSKNDSILLSEGYKLTGNKRELIVK